MFYLYRSTVHYIQLCLTKCAAELCYTCCFPEERIKNRQANILLFFNTSSNANAAMGLLPIQIQVEAKHTLPQCQKSCKV